MTNSPDEIRANIERTRGDLSGDVDALADKVRPSSIAHRQVGKVRGALGSVRERVMGAASDVTDRASSTASDLGESVAGAPRAVVDKAEGHPIAVGLIAFGVGLLVSSLIPASTKERELAGTIKDTVQPQLADAAKQVAGNLREPAQEAVAAVKDSATEAVDNVKSEASDARDDVTGSASDAASEVRSNAANDQ
jgi:uncharacterized protein YjbJ (UPF0337 family)